MSIATRENLKTPRLIAIVTGILGMLLALSTPLLPIEQDSASIDWPQNPAGVSSVEAPLVTYAPDAFTASIPCSALTGLKDGGTLLSTAPSGAADVQKTGLVMQLSDSSLKIVLRDRVLATTAVDSLSGQGCTIALNSTSARTTLDLDGTQTVLDGDFRPQLVGIFSDLTGAAPAGLNVHVDVDSRFSSSPSVLKLLVMFLGAALTIVSLFALHRLDGIDLRRARRFFPSRWWKLTLIDGVVLGTLLVWHFIGANTSDDGYLLNMARVSEHAGYMANYYRWFGVPEAPFGMPYYDMLALLAKVSTASIWMRLITLVAGVACWLVISREVIPRLGRAVITSKVAIWTAGLVFLAFWLPYDNGLRPEPLIALGALLTWCSIERAIATGRLLPAGIAVVIAAFSLAAGPTGLICIAALLSGLRPIVQILVTRAKVIGVAGLLAPILASGTVVLVAMFADQSLASVLEATKVRQKVGPNVAWFDERLRWDALLNISPDGSLARRFGVFAMLLCLAVVVAVMLRRGGKIPGTATGPSRRILGIVFGALVLMMFTPTKWTHHFGVYAGLAGSLAALGAVAVATATVTSPRNRTLFTAAVLFLTALAFTGSNGWWYVSSYGIPWFDKPPSIAGKGFSTLLLGLAVLALIFAAYQHVRAPYQNVAPKKPRIAPSALTIIAGGVVLFEVLSLVKGAVTQYPAYSIARSNIESLAGDTCSLANDVLVETDPNKSMLQPVVPNADPLGSTETTGFTANGVASDLTADAEADTSGSANSVQTTPGAAATTTSNTAGTTGGNQAGAGINGSTVKLPFGLDPATTPVLGSFGSQEPSKLTSSWYALPGSGDIISIAAAGRIRSVDKDGIVTPGQSLVVEYGVTGADGQVRSLGSVTPIDIGPAPSWRNLRVPLSELPREANAVRLVADDEDLNPDQWLAVTPPRVPQTQTLNSVVGSTDPVLLDWSVGLAFPCQRPFDHRYGVAEVPKYRILPDRVGAESTNAWQDSIGGGPLGWTSLLLSSETMPTYLNHDWARDWGSLEKYSPLDSAATPANVQEKTVDRSGLWTPGPIRVS